MRGFTILGLPGDYGRRGLARRLLVSIVLFSSLITLVITAVQLYIDYHRDVSLIDSRFEQIRDVHLESIGDSLWSLHENEAQVLVDGILQLPDLVYLEILDGGEVWVSAGTELQENVIVERFTLYGPGAGEGKPALGELRVVATLNQVYQRLFDKAIIVLISNAIKTFLVAGFILLLVHLLITRHLVEVTQFMREQDLENPSPLSLDRVRRSDTDQDELDMLAEGLNTMRDDLQASFEQIRQAEKKYRALFDTMAQGVIYQDPDGRVTSANHAAEMILGLTQDQLMGRTSFDPEWRVIRENGDEFPGDEHPAMVAIRDGKTVSDVSMGVYHPDKRGFSWILVSSRPEFRQGDDKPFQVFSTFTDITARKRIERERENLIEELEAKNIRLERFAYTVSHELKTPLVTIGGFTGMLRRDYVEGTTQRVEANFTQIETALASMAELLEDLLKLARVGHVDNKPESVSLSELAREAANHLEFQGFRANIDIDISSDMPQVVVDRARLLEVMQNLIENAAKFSADTPRPRISINADYDGEQVVCSVDDNGRGIEPEYQERVFNLFERLDLKVEGTGVGLALVRGIIETFGGKVWVESDGPGAGSTFYFTIPGKEYNLEDGVEA